MAFGLAPIVGVDDLIERYRDLAPSLVRAQRHGRLCGIVPSALTNLGFGEFRRKRTAKSTSVRREMYLRTAAPNHWDSPPEDRVLGAMTSCPRTRDLVCSHRDLVSSHP